MPAEVGAAHFAEFLQATQGFLKPLQIGLCDLDETVPALFGFRREEGADVALGVTSGEQVGAEFRQGRRQVVPHPFQFAAQKRVIEHEPAVILHNAQSLARPVGAGVENAGQVQTLNRLVEMQRFVNLNRRHTTGVQMFFEPS